MVDRYGLAGQVTAFFLFPLFLGSKFAAGSYRVKKWWTISSTTFSEDDTFEVTTAGNKDGPAHGLGTFSLPALDWALMPCRSGRVKALRNPRSL